MIRSWKAGALAPSARADLPLTGAAAFGRGGLLADWLPDPALGAVTLAAVALRAAGRGAAGDAAGEFADFLALLGLFAVARRAFAADVLADDLVDVLADVADSPRAILPEDALAVFLRVFLDIRLPFVAFNGSIIRLLRVVSRQT